MRVTYRQACQLLACSAPVAPRCSRAAAVHGWRSIKQAHVSSGRNAVVVAGCTGGFESGFNAPVGSFGGAGGGQTREHAQLAKSLGVDQLAVVVTKLDTCDFDADRFEHIRCVTLPK